MSTYDVIIASDLRFPGGTSTSLVEEIKAQAAAGMRTGLVHLPTAALKSDPPRNPKFDALLAEGAVEIVEEDAHARLTVIRHPGVLTEPPPTGITIDCDAAVIVANQVPRDRSRAVYDPAVAHRNAAHWLRRQPVWATISGAVRREAAAADSLIPILPWTWTNIIHADEWGSPRTHLAGPTPVVGRHGRPQPMKWPQSAETLRAVYPPDGSIRVRVLGGADPVADVIGEIPSAWEVLPFDSMDPRDFLAGIDFLVYFHAEEMTEAFGRVILEALASGAVAIAPQSFEEVFGAGCVYAEPEEVQAVIHDLSADPDRFAAQSRRGHAVAADRFSPEQHLGQLGAFFRTPPAPAIRHRLPSTPEPKILRPLFVCTNGVGVGHLTRVSAIARRSSPWTKPVILTLCAASQIPAFAGVPVEHFPTPHHSGLDNQQWNDRFRDTLTHLIDLHQIDAVVFDGPWPFKGLLQARKAHDHLPFIWSRRGMAKGRQDLGTRAAYFDAVIVPRDVGSSGRTDDTDVLPTAFDVDPILLVDTTDLLDVADAKRTLGLELERPAVLVQLGAGNINDTAALHETVISQLEAIGSYQICVTKSAISRVNRQHENVVSISHYPLSACYAAFDFAVSACGYNSFHEAIAFALPTVFIPNTDTTTDDQEARAANASGAGVALCARPDDEEAITAAIKSLADSETRDAIREACRGLFPGNGARSAMTIVEEVTASWRS